MKHCMRMLAATSAMIVVLSAGIAGADHGGDDVVVTDTISLPTLYIHDPCSPPELLESLQGVTQFIVEIPRATWNHPFTLVGDDVLDDDLMPDFFDYDVDMFFYAKAGTSCTQLESPLGSGLVTTGTTHGVVVLSGADGEFTLTIDN